MSSDGDDNTYPQGIPVLTQADFVDEEFETLGDPGIDADFERHSDTFKTICASSHRLFRRKNYEYRDTIVETGVLGAAVELVGIAGRLKALVLKNRDHGRSHRDELIDILKDAHNYANIALMMLAEENWDGDR